MGPGGPPPPGWSPAPPGFSGGFCDINYSSLVNRAISLKERRCRHQVGEDHREDHPEARGCVAVSASYVMVSAGFFYVLCCCCIFENCCGPMLADVADQAVRGGRAVRVVSDHPMFLIPPPSKLSSSSTLCCR
uniref:Uncharacterized protein n=1 Tax=Salix viminalis TaxID=40686 RepID=A0A6N2KUY9_SALVM